MFPGKPNPYGKIMGSMKEGEEQGEHCKFWVVFGLLSPNSRNLPKVPSYLKIPALLFKQSLFNYIYTHFYFIVAFSIIISLEIGSQYYLFNENCSDVKNNTRLMVWHPAMR